MMQRIKGVTPRRLLEIVANAQQQFMLGGSSTDGFDNLLSGLLELTGSRHGFIAELVDEGMDRKFLRVLATSASLVTEEARDSDRDLPIRQLAIRELQQARQSRHDFHSTPLHR